MKLYHKIIIIVLTIISIPISSYGWTWIGYYWKEGKAGFRFIDSGYKGKWKKIVRNAAGTWNNSGACFEFYEDNMAQNGFLRDNLGDPNLNTGVILGKTVYSLNPDNITLKDVHTIITDNQYVEWSTRGNCPSDMYDVETAVLHELGHWLHLSESSSHPEAVMYPDLRMGVMKRKLSQDDIDGIKYIYPITDTVKITDAIPQRETSSSYNGEIFYTTNFSFDYMGGTVILSQYQDGTGNTCVDDSISIIVTNPDGIITKWNYIYTQVRFPEPIPPVDITSIFGVGVNQVRAELWDVYGSVVSSTSLWLVGGAVPGKAISGEKYENQFIADVDSGGRIKKSENYQFELFPNYPNPTKEIANIQFSIPRAGKVELKIYNLAGQLVKVLVNENMPAGKHQCSWVGRDESNHKVGQGVYIYRMTAGAFSATKKLIWVK